MDTIHLVLYTLLVAWGAVTVILICALIYRSTLETHEDDQIFLDAAGESMANEQRLLVAQDSETEPADSADCSPLQAHCFS